MALLRDSPRGWRKWSPVLAVVVVAIVTLGIFQWAEPSILGGSTNNRTSNTSGLLPARCIPACPPPPLRILENPASGNVPLTVQFGAVIGFGSAPYTYSWHFGDGGSSTAASPAHTYTSLGTFTVTLTVKDSAGTSESATNYVSTSCSSTVVKGQVDISGTSTGIYGAVVTLSTGAITESSSSGSYSFTLGCSAGGTYTVSAQAVGLSGTATASVTVSSGATATAPTLALSLGDTTNYMRMLYSAYPAWSGYGLQTYPTNTGSLSYVPPYYPPSSGATSGLPTGGTIVQISGQDNAPGAGTDANAKFVLGPTYSPLAGGTIGPSLSVPMDLRYYVWVASSPDQGRFSVDLEFAGGTTMSASTDSFGHPIFDSSNQPCYASDENWAFGSWVPVTCDLSELRDKTVYAIELVYDDGAGGQRGFFSAYFGGIELVSAAYPEGVTNPGFESGLSGWVASGSSPPTVMGAGGNAFFTGTYGGSKYTATVGPDGPLLGCAPASTSDLSQPFQIPDEGEDGLHIILTYWIATFVDTAPGPHLRCPVGSSYGSVYLDDRTTQSTVSLQSSISTALGWTQEQFDLTSMGLAGHIVWLHFHNVDASGYAWSEVAVDNVQVTEPYVSYSEDFASSNSALLTIPSAQYGKVSNAFGFNLQSEFAASSETTVSWNQIGMGQTPAVPVIGTAGIMPVEWQTSPCNGNTCPPSALSVSLALAGEGLSVAGSGGTWEYLAIPYSTCITWSSKWLGSGNPSNTISLVGGVSGENMVPTSGSSGSESPTGALEGALGIGLDSVGVLSDFIPELELALAATGVGTVLDVFAVAADIVFLMLQNQGADTSCSGSNSQDWISTNANTIAGSTYTGIVALGPVAPAAARALVTADLGCAGTASACAGGGVYQLTFTFSMYFVTFALDTQTWAVQPGASVTLSSTYALTVNSS
jgi:PKD repeat protein